MNLVDSQLYRPLKSGQEFERLIPAYKGVGYKFDKKKDNSTTYDTLRFMAQWANKYAYQMSKVAPILKAGTLQQTVNNIYSFLYWHFQYKLDGEMQKLYSPSAAWHFRKTGFDCKTYSILASTILQNLQIPHSFRMIQQAGIMPGEWSHVYVIVPNGNNYYTIDATTHNNKEVSFTKKHDHIMKHIGLAAPFTGYEAFNGLGCACQGTPIKSTGLGSPAVLSNTIKNFHSFLNVLEANGISREVTSRMLAMVKWNIENRIDPNMGEILRKALATTPQQGLGVIESVSSLTAAGGTYGSMSYSIPTTGTVSTMINVAQGSGGWTTELTKGFSIDGKPLTEITSSLKDGVTGVVSGDYGAVLSSVSKLIPIDKTFGAVFANGFDLSCWGSSFSESIAKKDMQVDFPFMQEWSGIYKISNTDNLEKFLTITENYYQDAIDPKRRNYASCTKKGHALVAKAIINFRNETLEQFKNQGFTLVPNGKKTMELPRLPFPGKGSRESDKLWRWASGKGKVTFDTYQVVSPQAAKATQTNGTTGTSTGTNTGAAAEKKSNLSTIVTIGSAIALGAKLLL